jgi:hypothetical protein
MQARAPRKGVNGPKTPGVLPLEGAPVDPSENYEGLLTPPQEGDESGSPRTYAWPVRGIAWLTPAGVTESQKSSCSWCDRPAAQSFSTPPRAHAHDQRSCTAGSIRTS